MPESIVQYLNLPFLEAIAFFRRKVSITTERWDELWQEMHDRAFTVAGAMQADLLDDLRGAVEKAISEGTTLADFRKDFDKVVQDHGWAYKGGRAWRTAIIYDTNLSTAYAAGHYRQRNHPAVLAVRPYLRYLPSSSAHQRVEHQAWYGLVLRHDDPFWDTHTPPNGWGCKCGVTTVSRRELERLQQEQDINTTAPEIRWVEKVNTKTGQVYTTPQGIDPGWAYNPGKTPWAGEA